MRSSSWSKGASGSFCVQAERLQRAGQHAALHEGAFFLRFGAGDAHGPQPFGEHVAQAHRGFGTANRGVAEVLRGEVDLPVWAALGELCDRRVFGAQPDRLVGLRAGEGDRVFAGFAADARAGGAEEGFECFLHFAETRTGGQFDVGDAFFHFARFDRDRFFDREFPGAFVHRELLHLVAREAGVQVGRARARGQMPPGRLRERRRAAEQAERCDRERSAGGLPRERSHQPALRFVFCAAPVCAERFALDLAAFFLALRFLAFALAP